jgi:hypothetical protein
MHPRGPRENDDIDPKTAERVMTGDGAEPRGGPRPTMTGDGAVTAPESPDDMVMTGDGAEPREGPRPTMTGDGVQTGEPDDEDD